MDQIFLTLGAALMAGAIGYFIGHRLGHKNMCHFPSMDSLATLFRQPQPPGEDMPAMSSLGYGIVVVCDKDKRIFRSTDYGLTWLDCGILPGDFVVRK